METFVKILCVDDEPNILRALKRIFLDEHYQIFTAASGAEGLEILAGQGPIEVVLSDYRMPVMSGVEFLKRVREQWPDTIRIVLSGFADFGVVLAAINEGQIYKFVPKPWNDDELKVTVAKAIEVYRLQWNNRQLAHDLLRANADLARLNSDLARMVEKESGSRAVPPRCAMLAHDILYALPAAVALLDATGQVVYSNRAADLLFAPPGAALLNRAGRETLPAEVLELLARPGGEETVSGVLPLPGGKAQVRVARMRCGEEPDGMIVLVDPLLMQS